MAPPSLRAGLLVPCEWGPGVIRGSPRSPPLPDPHIKPQPLLKLALVYETHTARREAVCFLNSVEKNTDFVCTSK